MNFKFRDGFSTRNRDEKPKESGLKSVPEILYKVDNRVCRIADTIPQPAGDKVIIFVYFRPHLEIQGEIIGPKLFFRKEDNTWNWHGIKPLSELADITLKRRWARAAGMRYEEQPLVRIGGDTDDTTKVFTEE